MVVSGEGFIVLDMVLGVGNDTAALGTFLLGAAVTVCSFFSLFLLGGGGGKADEGDLEYRECLGS